jgi:hypothetical protein
MIPSLPVLVVAAAPPILLASAASAHAVLPPTRPTSWRARLGAWVGLAALLLTAQGAWAQANPAYPAPAAQAHRLSGTSTTYSSVGARTVKARTQAQAAAVTTLTFTSTAQGWFSPQSGHEASIRNYFVGKNGDNGAYRNFFSFPLTNLNVAGKQVVSASLSIADDGQTLAGNLPTVTYVLHDVSTPTATLAATQAANEAVTASVFADLGTGQTYGTYVSNTTVTGGRRVYTLGQAALTDIATHAGQDFAIGGMLVEEQASSYAFLFGYSGTTSQPQILTVELADAPTITTGAVNPFICAGGALDVVFVASGDFTSGNVFSAQLSNSFGSFTNPVTIGTLASTSSGIFSPSIHATIPANTPASSGYRVRVVSSVPAVTGTTSSTSITINAAPTLRLPSNQVAVAAFGTCTASVSLSASATGTPTPTLSYTLNGASIPATYAFPVGVNTVTAIASNGCSTTTGTFTVTVVDREPPVVRAAGFQTALVNGTRTIEAADVDGGSYDNCGAIASLSISPSTFTCANLGPNQVTLTVTDNAGNKASQTVTVIITDNTAPVILAAGLQVNLINGTRTIEAADIDYGSYDECGSIASLTLDRTTFTCANVGPNQVTLTVTDKAGNKASKTVTVVVVDNTAPVLRVAGFTAQLQNGTRTIEAADIDYGSYDECGSLATISISPRTFTCANVGPNQVTFTATDKAGNVSSQIVTVLITADGTCTPALAATQGQGNTLEAYPNPAHAQATLRFVAQQTGAARLHVYNTMGELVATLYSGVAEQGHVYERTLGGTRLPAGLYTCRFVQQGKTVTQRVVLTN